jgi:uncharacterized RDD family membrane protein YckC
MKCPKCGYLGFETGDRCRNCGYDFSLPAVAPSAEPDDDLMIKAGPEEDAALLDFTLRKEIDLAPQPIPSRRVDQELDLNRLIGAPESAAPPSSPPRSLSGEFPLFPSDQGADDQTPLARRRAIPRPPLAVRRATPEVARVRPHQTLRDDRTGAYETPPLAGLGLPSVASGDHLPASAYAPPVRRFAAALIDLLVLGAIDTAVVYFTLRLAGLDFRNITLLPWPPLAGFFLLLNGGYFVTFAAVGGQTIGQMAFGLRVVGDDGAPLAFGTATLRTLAWLFSALPLGLGLWFALSGDHRTLHDRLTATRVVLS